MADGTRLSLQALAVADAVILSLPFFVLVSLRSVSSSGEALEACGWTSSLLHITCIAAICCLLFSFILTSAQLVLLGMEGTQPTNSTFARMLMRHLPFPALATFTGGLIGAAALWGHAVLQHEECNHEALVLLASAFVFTCVVVSMYVYASPVGRGSAHTPDASVSLLQVLPEHCSKEPKEFIRTSKDKDGSIYENFIPESPRSQSSAPSRELSPKSGSEKRSNLVVYGETETVCAPHATFKRSQSEGSGTGTFKQSHTNSSKSNIKRASSMNSDCSRNNRKRVSCMKRASSMNSTCSINGNTIDISAMKRSSMKRTGSMNSTCGKSGKSASPLNEVEILTGKEKEDRFEGVFAERRKSFEDTGPTGMSVDMSNGNSQHDVTHAESAERTRESTERTSCEAIPSALRDASKKSRKSVCIMPDVVTSSFPDEREQINSSPKSKSKLDMDVVHYSSCPINFNTCMGKAEGLDESTSESDGDAEPQVEVPIWLIDQKTQALIKTDAQSSDEEGFSEDQHDSSEEWSGDEKESEDQIAPLPPPLPVQNLEPPSELTDRLKKPRISFLDQVNGTALPQYSKEKEKKSLKERKSAKKINLAVRAGSAPAINHPFWKIPRPTRRGTAMPAPIVRGALHNVPDVADELEEIDMPEKAFPKKKMSVRAPSLPGTLEPPSKAALRRPSVLSVFSESGVRREGKYELPQVSQDTGETTRELVEVRRQSLHMSKSMMTDLLMQKLDRDQLDDRDIDPIAEGDDTADEEIILPFFVVQNNMVRKCNCKVDPESGQVIHTCMTPAATMCENTQNYASYVCSAWGTRASTKKSSRIQTKAASKVASRRGSVEKLEVEDEDDRFDAAEQLETNRAEKEARMKNKRIRNASMLEVVGRAAPAPAKQNPEKSGSDEKNNSDSEEDKPEENELSVSYHHLRRVSMGQMELELSGQSPSERGYAPEDDACRRPLDMQVESELGHRFELVQPWELAQWLTDHEKRENLLVVDARGRDWVGAHIPSSINVRTSEICAHPEALTKQCLRNRIDHIVFTCMYSVLRARKSAIAVQQCQEDAYRAGLQSYRIRISLLAGGMHGWVNHFVSKGENLEKQNPYIQDFDRSCWCDGGPSQGGLVHVMDALWSEGGQQALSDALVAELNALAAIPSSPPSANASTSASRRSSQEAASRRASQDPKGTSASRVVESKSGDERAEQASPDLRAHNSEPETIT